LCKDVTAGSASMCKEVTLRNCLAVL